MNEPKKEEAGGPAALLSKLLDKVWGKPTKACARREAEQRQAEYLVCPVCKQIMSHRANKLVVIGRDMLRRPVYAHRLCAEIVRRKEAEKAAKRAAAKAATKGEEKQS